MRPSCKTQKAPIRLKLDHKKIKDFFTAHTFCASRDFLWVVPTNTGIFLCSLKLFGESRT